MHNPVTEIKFQNSLRYWGNPAFSVESLSIQLHFVERCFCLFMMTVIADLCRRLPQFAALSGTSTPQLLPPPPPQNGAIVGTDSVRTKAYLQNSETCSYEKFTLVGLKSSFFVRFTCVIHH